MAGVYIKGMEMPEACVDCFMRKECFGHREDIAFLEFIHGRSRDCPLVEVPDHGDLIDRDEVMKKHSSWFYEGDVVCGNIKAAPAVIPAERSEK